jgi:hypothetical protein
MSTFFAFSNLVAKLTLGIPKVFSIVYSIYRRQWGNLLIAGNITKGLGKLIQRHCGEPHGY